MSHNTSLAYRLLPQSLQDAYADGNARLTDLTNNQVSKAASWHVFGMQETKGHVEQESSKNNIKRCTSDTSDRFCPEVGRRKKSQASSGPEYKQEMYFWEGECAALWTSLGLSV